MKKDKKKNNKKKLVIILSVILGVLVIAIVSIFIYFMDAASKGFHKEHITDRVWWYRENGQYGSLKISFDKKKIYNLWTDYPDNMTEEEVKIFDKENPFWAEFFKK